eukprot:s22_g39.t1
MVIKVEPRLRGKQAPDISARRRDRRILLRAWRQVPVDKLISRRIASFFDFVMGEEPPQSSYGMVGCWKARDQRPDHTTFSPFSGTARPDQLRGDFSTSVEAKCFV